MATVNHWNSGLTREALIRAGVAWQLANGQIYTSISASTNYYSFLTSTDTHYFYTGSSTATSAAFTTGTSSLGLVTAYNGMQITTAFNNMVGAMSAGTAPSLPDADGCTYYGAWTPTLTETKTKFAEHAFIMNTTVDGDHVDFIRVRGVAYSVGGVWYISIGTATGSAGGLETLVFNQQFTFTSATINSLVSATVSALNSNGVALEATNQFYL